ncbi:site-specific integrase [Vibrio viridaestus]|uniref:Site-specific integrase n=1 Tax=Vibrio viridaestus TaxID=2487322 RepID=A0A3N9U2A7_9VIBR|nr:site-specific integrase [Vibrio viridaestus]
MVALHAWETIWIAYKPLLDERLKLWRKKYNKGIKSYPDCLWLTETGKPVNPNDVQAAFRQAREEIQETNDTFPMVTPHWLRHTFACGLISNYCDKLGIEIDPDNEVQLHQIHQSVTDLLGHKDMATTERYIRTIKRIVNRRLLPDITYRLAKDGNTILNAGIMPDSLEKVDSQINWQETVEHHRLLTVSKCPLQQTC